METGDQVPNLQIDPSIEYKRTLLVAAALQGLLGRSDPKEVHKIAVEVADNTLVEMENKSYSLMPP